MSQRTCWMCNQPVGSGFGDYRAHLQECPEMADFHRRPEPVPEARPEDTQVLSVTATQPIPVAQPARALPLPQRAAPVAPAPRPAKAPDVWDKEGYRKPKEADAWVFQGLWFVAGLVALFWLTATTGAAFIGIFFALACWSQIAYVEYWARCEDRRKVAIVGVSIFLFGELLSRHAKYDARKTAEQERRRGW